MPNVQPTDRRKLKLHYELFSRSHERLQSLGTHADLREALDAVKLALRWSEIFTSPPFNTNGRQTVACFSSEEEREDARAEDLKLAPCVVEVPGWGLANSEVARLLDIQYWRCVAI